MRLKICCDCGILVKDKDSNVHISDNIVRRNFKNKADDDEKHVDWSGSDEEDYIGDAKIQSDDDLFVQDESESEYEEQVIDRHSTLRKRTLRE